MKFLTRIPVYSLFILLPLIVISCSAATGSRYEKSKESKTETKTKTGSNNKLPEEDFSMVPYRTKVDIKENTIDTLQNQTDLSAWYGFNNSDTTANILKQTVIDKVSGFRVQVYSTDNLTDANNKRSEMFFKTNQKNVYVVFDPPYYKVEVGDFTSLQDAKDLSFKLNQMGYTDAHVVNETVNVFE